MKHQKIGFAIACVLLVAACDRESPRRSAVDLLPKRMRAGDARCELLVSPFLKDMTRPGKQSASAVKNMVELDAESDFYWNGVLIGRDTLFTYLGLVSEMPERPKLVIRTDRHATCRNLLRLLFESKIPLVCERASCTFEWATIPRDYKRFMPYLR